MVSNNTNRKVLKSQLFGGQYVQGDLLGKGAQACVYKFYHKSKGDSTKTLYACKETNMDYIRKCPPQKQTSRWNSMIRELVILE